MQAIYQHAINLDKKESGLTCLALTLTVFPVNLPSPVRTEISERQRSNDLSPLTN